MADILLKVSNLSVSYGRFPALRDIDLDVPAAAVVAVVGPNGAGKSTLLAAIAGGIRTQGGGITFAGEEIRGRSPESLAALGLSLVPEGRHVFPSLTVEENLLVGGFLRGNTREVQADMERMLRYFPRLKERLDQPGGKLSGGEQQMLVLARALMTRPRLLMIDEPSLGLAPKVIDEVYDILFGLRMAEGLTLLINEQSAKRVMRFADEIHVLRTGRIQLSARTSELGDEQVIAAAYFGTLRAREEMAE